MKKKDLAKKVSESTSLSEATISDVIDAVFEEIGNSLKKGEEVKIFGFGKFVTRPYGERKCYNPINGEMMKLPPSVQPGFVAGTKLRDKINN